MAGRRRQQSWRTLYGWMMPENVHDIGYFELVAINVPVFAGNVPLVAQWVAIHVFSNAVNLMHNVVRMDITRFCYVSACIAPSLPPSLSLSLPLSLPPSPSPSSQCRKYIEQSHLLDPHLQSLTASPMARLQAIAAMAHRTAADAAAAKSLSSSSPSSSLAAVADAVAASHGLGTPGTTDRPPPSGKYVALGSPAPAARKPPSLPIPAVSEAVRLGSVLQILAYTRGMKTVCRFLPNSTADVEPTLALLQAVTQWQVGGRVLLTESVAIS